MVGTASDSVDGGRPRWMTVERERELRRRGRYFFPSQTRLTSEKTLMVILLPSYRKSTDSIMSLRTGNVFCVFSGFVLQFRWGFSGRNFIGNDHKNPGWKGYIKYNNKIPDMYVILMHINICVYCHLLLPTLK